MTFYVEARLPKANIRGTRDALGIARFNAIPYAAPPIGQLRFQPPLPVTCEGPVDATGPGTLAPQLRSRLNAATGDMAGEQSEDCLHLTIWTPAADSERRPVVLWIHGGAWQSGAGAVPWHDGARLAKEGDVVVVAINYRLAALGWLCLPGMTANLGLLDQETAIDWVIEHIEHFGGNPHQLTVMGQSAGASCIAALHLRCPRFQRIILQSGVLGRSFRSLEQAHELGQKFLEATGASTIEALSALPVETLLNAQRAPSIVQALHQPQWGGRLFTLVADGVVLPREANARASQLPGYSDVLVGYTKDEMSAFPDYGLDARSVAEGESRFGAPARQWADQAHAAERRSWLYRIDYGPNPQFGACHCIDLPLVFGTLSAFESAPMLSGQNREHTEMLSAQIRAAWLRFIRGESPGWEAAPAMQFFN